jgi:hypothetical protein
LSIPRHTAILALALHVCAAATPVPAPAPNCGLTTPPATAGVDRHMGVLLKIYPRNPDIGPDYGGCQTLWAQSGDGWETVTVVRYAAGHVTRVDNPALPQDPVGQCLVRGGVVESGDPELCAQLDDMRFESLPAACLDTPSAPDCVRR